VIPDFTVPNEPQITTTRRGKGFQEILVIATLPGLVLGAAAARAQDNGACWTYSFAKVSPDQEAEDVRARLWSRERRHVSR